MQIEILSIRTKIKQMVELAMTILMIKNGSHPFSYQMVSDSSVEIRFTGHNEYIGPVLLF